MIFLALGSNLTSSFGDRFVNINLAISYLEGYEIQIIKKSDFYEIGIPIPPGITGAEFKQKMMLTPQGLNHP